MQHASLWNKLAQATEWHDVILPDGYESTYYIGDGLSDNIRRLFDATIWWENLTASFIQQSPAATP